MGLTRLPSRCHRTAFPLWRLEGKICFLAHLSYWHIRFFVVLAWRSRLSGLLSAECFSRFLKLPTFLGLWSFPPSSQPVVVGILLLSLRMSCHFFLCLVSLQPSWERFSAFEVSCDYIGFTWAIRSNLTVSASVSLIISAKSLLPCNATYEIRRIESAYYII